MKYLKLFLCVLFLAVINSCGKGASTSPSSGSVNPTRQDIGCELGDLNNLSQRELMKIGLKAYDCGVTEAQIVQIID